MVIEREELFRLITESAADMIAVVDTSGRRLYNSPSYEQILGYTPEELSGTTAMAQIHPEDREEAVEGWRRCVPHRHGLEPGIPHETQGRQLAHARVEGEYDP